MGKKKKETVAETTSINLSVPNDLYWDISDKVLKQKRAGNKATIHDKCIYLMQKGNELENK